MSFNVYPTASDRVNEATQYIDFTVTRGAFDSPVINFRTVTTYGFGNVNDFAPLDIEVWFNDNELSKTVRVPITQDGLVEGEETFGVELYQAGQPWVEGSSSFTIYDDMWRFTPTALTLAEGNNSTITLHRANGNLLGSELVYLQVLGFGGPDGSDYTVTGSLLFANGQSDAVLTVQTFRDTALDGNETVTLSAYGSVYGGEVGPADRITITITDSANYVLTPDTATISETSSSSTFTLSRNITTRAETVYLTMVPGTNFTASDVSGLWTDFPVTFAVGESSKSIVLPLADDTLSEAPEQFSLIVQLSASDPANVFQDRSVFTITSDDALAYTVAPLAASFAEGLGTATVRVSSNSNLGGVVWLETYAITTPNDSDFLPPIYAPGTSRHMLVFESGQTYMDVPITLLNDSYYESTETFGVRVLTDPSGGTVYATGTFTIADDDVEPAAGITTAATIADHETLLGSLEAAGDADWYRITLEAGANYTIRLDKYLFHGATLADPLVAIYDAIGTQLAYDDDGGVGNNSMLSFRAPASGTYYIAARSFGDKYAGGFQLSVNAVLVNDDFGSTPVITGVSPWITPGTPRTGNIENIGDADWFPIAMTAGTAYTILLDGKDTQGGTLGDPHVYLYSATGQLIRSADDGGGGTSSLLNFTPSADGTYFIGARAFGDRATGTYTVNVSGSTGGAPEDPNDDFGSSLASGSTPPLGAISVGGTALGTLGMRGDDDWFAVTLVGGDEYVFRLDGSAANLRPLGDPYLYLLDASGAVVASRDDGGSGANSLLRYTAPASGVYYLSARSFNDAGTGDYQLSVTGPGATGPGGAADDFGSGIGSVLPLGAIGNGGTVNANIGHAGDIDWFQTTLTPGLEYTISLQGAASGSGTLGDPKLYLHDAAGQQLAMDDDGGVGVNALMHFTPTAGGTFYIGARSASDLGTGTYLLSLSGSSGTTSPGDDYGSSLLPGATPAIGSITVGASVAGTLGARGDADWFAITLTAGTEYAIRLDSYGPEATALGDPFVYLHDSTGALIASRDDGAAGANSLLRYTPEASGTFYISARSFADRGTGNYLLSVSGAGGGGPSGPGDDFGSAVGSTAPGLGTLAIGGSATGVLGAAGDSDWFAITLQAGTEYAIGLNGSATGAGTLADPRVYLHDAAGTLIASDDDSGASVNALLRYTPMASGTYYVAARSFNDLTTGSYTVTLAGTSGIDAPGDDYGSAPGATAPANGTVAVGATATGTLAVAGDADWFSVSLTAGLQYTIRLNGAGTEATALGDPFLYVHDAAGTLLAWRDDGSTGANSLLRFTPDSSGTYYLSARSFADRGTGNYALSVSVGESAGVGTDDFAATVSTAGTLAVGSMTGGNLEASGDADWFRITLDGGTEYTLGLNRAGTVSTALRDPHLYLYDASGAPVADIDDGGTGANSLLRFTPSGAGSATYFIGARADGDSGTGTYQVTLVSGGEGTPGPGDEFSADILTTGIADVGTPVSGALQHAGDADWFAVNLVGGVSYAIHLDGSGSSALADPYVYLHDADGTLVASRDDGGAGVNSLLRFTPAADATYFVSARSFNDLGTGTYEVEVIAEVVPVALGMQPWGFA